MIVQRRKLLILPIIYVSFIVLCTGCCGMNRAINKKIRENEKKEYVKNLPYCPRSAYPLNKTRITPKEFITDFDSILIFHTESTLGTINSDITPEKIFSTTIKMLRAKGYKVELSHKIDDIDWTDNIECRHCGDLKVETKGVWFDRKYAEENCLFVGRDYTTFFKKLADKYPETEQYEILAFIAIYIDTDSLSPHIYLYDKRKKTLILKSLIREIHLKDKHRAPSGYAFSTSAYSSGMFKSGESRLSCAWRGLKKILSILPNISGKSIPENEKASLPKAYVYEYYLGNKPRQRVYEIKADTKPEYWIFTYAE